jgi:arylsulfatase
VVIILDAARADRFSFAGHDRLTTPRIDELARESLVFPNAFALAPYTLNSIPTMITGLSHLDHRVVWHEDVLHPDAVTFAESLAEVGFRTACFSATPNNSIAKGFNQGYEVFREIWTEGKKRQNRRAHFTAERVIDWLDETSSDPRPLHLQVHMVPPHAPYDPPERFDVFSDPTYEGPCDGYQRTLKPLDRGEMEGTRACLDHLLDLYDGNLRTADDATGLILDALKRRPRWNETAILITSDHGEAFMEHGRMEHNSTLYTEMLHVPFVLRLPPSWVSRDVDTEKLVTLADLSPTLLGLAGVQGAKTPDGIDLLARTESGRGRFFVSRTADIRPVMGLRSLEWSLMVGARGSAALFDLATDPGEQHDVRHTHPARFAMLKGILERRIGQPPRLPEAERKADLTELERGQLEALGYLGN